MLKLISVIVIGKDMKELIDDKVASSDSIIIQNSIDHHDIEVKKKIKIKFSNSSHGQVRATYFLFFW